MRLSRRRSLWFLLRKTLKSREIRVLKRVRLIEDSYSTGTLLSDSYERGSLSFLWSDLCVTELGRPTGTQASYLPGMTEPNADICSHHFTSLQQTEVHKWVVQTRPEEICTLEILTEPTSLFERTWTNRIQRKRCRKGGEIVERWSVILERAFIMKEEEWIEKCPTSVSLCVGPAKLFIGIMTS